MLDQWGHRRAFLHQSLGFVKLLIRFFSLGNGGFCWEMQRSSIENSWRLGGSLRSRRSGHGQRGTASTREVKLKKTMREAAGRVPTYGKMMTPGILHQILMRKSRDLAGRFSGSS